MIPLLESRQHYVFFRILLPVLLTFSLFVFTIFLIVLPFFESYIMDQKRLMIKELVHTVYSDLIYYVELEQSGELSRDEAQLSALEHIRALRYGPDEKDYFWINDMQPRMLVHPYRPDLEGEDLSNFADPQGKLLFVEFVKTVEASGSGYVDYMWQWLDDANQIVPKISYVQGFEPWGWVIGTGIYIEDVRMELAAARRRLLILCGVILILVAMLYSYVIREAYVINKQRQEAQREMRDSEVRYRTLFEAANDSLFLLDGTVFIDCNHKTEEIFGYECGDIIGKTIADLSPEEQPTGEQSHTSMLALFEESAIVQAQCVEWRYQRSDGQVFDTEMSLNRFELYGQTYTIAVVRDITKRKQAEAEREQLLMRIRAQARQVQDLIDTVPEGMFLLDSSGRVMLANPVARQALDTLVLAQTGDTISYLGDKSLAELLTSPLTKGLWHEVRADGRIFEVISRPMVDESQLEKWVLILRDVTQERVVREQLQRSERLAAVGQLAAGIAHDFNNIMAIIVLYAKMDLRHQNIPASLRQHLEIIDQQAKRATDMIQQILDFSRRAVLERQSMDLVPFLKELVKLLRRTMPENIKINLSSGNDEYIVNADPTRIQQAIMNLTINARDAMRSMESGELHIALSRTDEKAQIWCMTCGKSFIGEWVRIAVTDSGEGIPPEVLPHIFEPFFTTKEVGKGSGLGLPQVLGIVAAHEGHIDVTTTLGAGTTFIIYLPALLLSQPEVQILEDHAFVKGQGETILVVEDNFTLRQALASTLESLNYQVLEAANGREALEILENTGFSSSGISLVLSDMVMPEMGGQALFYAMQQRSITLPVVMLSGHPLKNKLNSLQKQGLAGWMLKPPNMVQLSQLLAQALDGTRHSG